MICHVIKKNHVKFTVPIIGEVFSMANNLHSMVSNTASIKMSNSKKRNSKKNARLVIQITYLEAPSLE